MTEYHTIYKGPEGETTEWEDLQVKHGNFPKREPAWKPDKYAPEEDTAKNKDWIDNKDEGGLEELEDDDAVEDDRFLEEYRRKRVAELQRAALKPRFGSVEQIRGSEFVEKVTNAGEGIYVVVLLFKEGHSGCAMVLSCLEELAKQFPHTKFVKAVSTDVIPKYPDSNLPTVLLYHEAKCLQHIVGLAALGGKHTTAEQIVLILNKYGPVCGGNEEEDQQKQVKNLVKKLVEQRVEDDEDSDFSD